MHRHTYVSVHAYALCRKGGCLSLWLVLLWWLLFSCVFVCWCWSIHSVLVFILRVVVCRKGEYIHIYTHIHICICMQACCIHMCIYIYIYICIYVYVYMYIHNMCVYIVCTQIMRRCRTRAEGEGGARRKSRLQQGPRPLCAGTAVDRSSTHYIELYTYMLAWLHGIIHVYIYIYVYMYIYIYIFIEREICIYIYVYVYIYIYIYIYIELCVCLAVLGVQNRQ